MNGKHSIAVPFASDGSAFLPSLRRTRGFQIGIKGQERWITDYWEALRLLRQASPAYFRRPSRVSGRFGIVRTQTWKHIPVDLCTE